MRFPRRVTASLSGGPSIPRRKGVPGRGGSAGRLGEPASRVRPRRRGHREVLRASYPRLITKFEVAIPDTMGGSCGASP